MQEGVGSKLVSPDLLSSAQPSPTPPSRWLIQTHRSSASFLPGTETQHGFWTLPGGTSVWLMCRGISICSPKHSTGKGSWEPHSLNSKRVSRSQRTEFYSSQQKHAAATASAAASLHLLIGLHVPTPSSPASSPGMTGAVTACCKVRATSVQKLNGEPQAAKDWDNLSLPAQPGSSHPRTLGRPRERAQVSHHLGASQGS